MATLFIGDSMKKQRINYLAVDRLDIQEELVINGTLVSLADERAKVSSNDSTAGYLNGKLVAGANISLTENNNGGNETLTISSGLIGANYLYVSASSTHAANAVELQAKYDLAKTMGPSAINRIVIVAAPGYYNFGGTIFTMDTQYIDLVSLDGNRSIIFNAEYNGSNPDYGSISVTANDVKILGVDVGTKMFRIDTGLALLKIENCKAGDYSFGGWWDQMTPPAASGVFKDCQAGEYSFGATASGTFVNCVASTGSFGNEANASGVFTNCTAGQQSFGYRGLANGTFQSCTSGSYSFGSTNNAAISSHAGGSFSNCISGDYSFGYKSNASGVFKNCTSGAFSFGNLANANGLFIGCVGSSSCFGQGAGANASGTFENCVGADGSFGADGTASGVFTNCIARDFGEYSFGGYGTASGTFSNCVAGVNSFGRNGVLSGKLFYCRLRSGTFQTVSGSGLTRYCIDGNNATNNQN